MQRGILYCKKYKSISTYWFFFSLYFILGDSKKTCKKVRFLFVYYETVFAFFVLSSLVLRSYSFYSIFLLFSDCDTCTLHVYTHDYGFKKQKDCVHVNNGL